MGLAILLPGAGRAQPPNAYRIIAFGDFGVGGDFQRSFGQAVRAFEARNRSNMLLALGDNDYTESPTAFRANWAASFGWGRSRGLAVAGVIGNHDARVQGGRYEFSTLGMRGRYYKRAAGPAELFLLDSNRIDAAQTAWLARSLARSKARWKIAVFHHPAYTCGTYRAHQEIVRRWVPLLERHGVVLALSGHDHNYQRLGPKRGVRYVVHGGGNSRLYPIASCPSGYPRRARGLAENGFVYLAIRPDRLDGWAVAPNGRRRDHFVVAG